MKHILSIVLSAIVLSASAQWNPDGNNQTTGSLTLGSSLTVNSGAIISSDFTDNNPGYSWSSNLSVRNNNDAINTFSRVAFVSQSGGLGAISLLKTDTYKGDMSFQVRNGAGFIVRLTGGHLVFETNAST
jgi:hypothetical protein